jgi:hypothetical protein
MKIHLHSLGLRQSQNICRIFLFLLVSVALFIMPMRGAAQTEQDEIIVAVQEIHGRVRLNDQIYYVLPGLQAGDELYVYAAGVSGNLDPFIALLDSEEDPDEILAAFYSDAEKLIIEGSDPLALLPTLVKPYFFAWNDDGGQAYDATLSYTIPQDGDYRLLLNSLIKDTFGDYRLLIGLNQPDILSGKAVITGDTLAIYDKDASQSGIATQEVTDTLDADNSSIEYRLREVEAGDTLYVRVERNSGNLRPMVILKDYGGKPIRSSNLSAAAANASLSYTFENQSSNYLLEIGAGCCVGDVVTSGTYQMVVGINNPDVFAGDVESRGDPIIVQPTEVEIGIKLQQITGIDQKAENFGAVASLAMRWVDPNLAFRPDSCDCQYKTYTGDRFSDFVSDAQGLWPEFTIYNQQGNRWSQNKDAVSNTEGQATYFERFSITLQAPDFDFRHFPFDTQQFYIRVDQLFPEEYYMFKEWPGYTEIGDQLGEEEWFITDWDTEITTQNESTENDTSRYSLRIEVRRHIDYYIFRFFIPIFLILVVGWITFFLKDYGKRVDVTGANLLAFIAYNFTIAGELPRLGYMTFMDAILVATFIVSVFILVYNVVLKRLEITGRSESAQRIDALMIWAYPIFYFIATLVVIWYFFIRAV